MKTLYLCGAINGCSDAEAKDWRETAKSRLSGLYRILDPMRRDYRGKEDESVAEIVDGDKADIAESDVLLVAADRPSWGTAMEVVLAAETGLLGERRKTIITVCGGPRVSPWLRYHSDKIIPTLEEAILLLERRA